MKPGLTPERIEIPGTGYVRCDIPGCRCKARHGIKWTGVAVVINYRCDMHVPSMLIALEKNS